MRRWEEQWIVKSERSGNLYTVSRDGDDWACSCLAWTKRAPRQDCKHILDKKLEITTRELTLLKTKVAAAPEPITWAGAYKAQEDIEKKKKRSNAAKKAWETMRSKEKQQSPTTEKSDLTIIGKRKLYFWEDE